MSDTFISEMKEGIIKLIAEGGINPKARFQTSQRKIKFPGRDLYYTFSVIPLYAKSGMSSITTTDKHENIRPDIDGNGNFNCITNYVGESRTYCNELRERFAKARREKYNLVILDPTAYVNRRFKNGEIIPLKKKKSTKK